MTVPTQAQIEALKNLLPGYEQYLEWCVERGVLFVKHGHENLEKAKEAIAALTAAGTGGQVPSGEAGVCATHVLRDKELIEQCAQEAERYDEVGAVIAAAIRAMKEKP